jgi:uncharacterized integral membrane protein
MQILLIFSFVIAFLAILFAIQNTTITSIRFLIWETQGSLALVLFIALVAGALISYLATAPGQIRQRMTISSQRKRISEVEKELSTTQDQLQQVEASLQEIEVERQAELVAQSKDAESSDSPEAKSDTE